MELTYKFGRGNWKTIKEGNEREWLIGNGIGGYSCHTIVGGGARAFHGYLIASMNPPVERYFVFARTQEQVLVEGREYDLTSQEYVNYEKNGQEYLQRYIFDSVPQYIYQVEDINIKKTIALEYGHNTAVVCYEVTNGSKAVALNLVPLFNFRAAGSTSEKNELKFQMNLCENVLRLIPESKKDMTITFHSSEGRFIDRALRPVSMATPNYLIEENQYYCIENRTGYLGLDNHYTPYDLRIDIKPYETKRFYVKCTVEELNSKDGFTIVEEYKKRAEALMKQSGFKDELALNLTKAADHFIVDRKSTGLKTVIAGFPFFTDWGRDTMIAFEGLTLCTGRFLEAREVLESFVKYEKNGLLPNVFPDKGSEPAYNTVDASLWYIQAVYQYLKYTGRTEDYTFVKEKLYDSMVEVIKAYASGTDFSIGMDEDGLIHAGSGMDQVTWMDVRVGELVVTPRHGKPVEINALWYNALCIMKELSKKFSKNYSLYKELADRVKESFNHKFWNENEQCLYDVVDEMDGKIRPNQIWAVSLPFTMLERDKEIKVVDKVYKELYSTYGLRTLSFKDSDYKPKYIGKLINRDLAYHMGTTWAYPIGAFISSYCKVNDYSVEAISRAKEMCEVFEDHMQDGCINGIAEIFDGDFASTSRGCFTQAWSVSEVLRAYSVDVLPYL